MTGFFTAPRIAWGPGALEQLSGLGARRALVAVDPNVARRGGERRVVEELSKTETHVEVVSDLAHANRVSVVERLKEQLGTYAPDWLVVVGGGTTIDAAKAARLWAERPEVGVEQFTPFLECPDPPRTRLAVLPSTSGSGAEASSTADLMTDDGRPFEVAHRGLTPEWALVDAGLADGLAPEQVADGAFESLSLAAEAYLSAWSNPFSDALALDAAATVCRRLAHALKWSDDPDAKSALHYAATGAGLAASNAQRGVAHALARALEGPSGLAYGRLLAVLLPLALEFDHHAARDRIEALAAQVAPVDEDGRSVVPLPTRVRRLAEVARTPPTLRAAGAPVDRIEAAREAIVAHALASPAVLANPRVPTREEMGSLLTAAIGVASGAPR